MPQTPPWNLSDFNIRSVPNHPETLDCVAEYILIKHELERSATEVSRALDGSSIPDIPTLEDIRDELTDLINDTIGSMRTPQIADHFGAMAQQWLNFTLQKKMHDIQGSPALENIQKVVDSVDDLL